MTEVLRPSRGGFVRPFGCAEFVVSFLKGEGPYGSATIDPSVGAPQTDILSEYKDAARRVRAENAVAKVEEKRIKRGERPLTADEADELVARYLRRIPAKSTGMRYHSFLIYFGLLKRLGWVEETAITEPSAVQANYPEAPPRRYYRLTAAGMAATEKELSDPALTLYAYSQEQRSPKKMTESPQKA